jgi:hypothetical protein
VIYDIGAEGGKTPRILFTRGFTKGLEWVGAWIIMDPLPWSANWMLSTGDQGTGSSFERCWFLVLTQKNSQWRPRCTTFDENGPLSAATVRMGRRQRDSRSGVVSCERRTAKLTFRRIRVCSCQSVHLRSRRVCRSDCVYNGRLAYLSETSRMTGAVVYHRNPRHRFWGVCLLVAFHANFPGPCGT